MTPMDHVRLAIMLDDSAALGQAISDGADVRVADCNGVTALHAAASFGRVQCVRVLIDAGVNVDAATDDYTTPLHLAALNGTEPCVQVLLRAGADLDLRDVNGRSAAHHAAWEGHLECLRALLDHGPAERAHDMDRFTPAKFAAASGHTDCFLLLLDRGSGIDELDRNDWVAAWRQATPDEAARLLRYTAEPLLNDIRRSLRRMKPLPRSVAVLDAMSARRPAPARLSGLLRP